MKFSQLAQFLEKLEKTSSRIEITQILADLFKKTDSEEIDKVVNLLLGRLAPSYEAKIFNIAEKMMLQALAQAYRKDVGEIRKIYKEKGDLGATTYDLSQKQSSSLSVDQVYDTLVRIAEDQGAGSVERKIAGIAKLLTQLDKLSARFVARIPVGHLRLGFSDKTIVDALSWMEKGDKSAKAEIEKAYHLTPDVAALAKRLKAGGTKKATKATAPAIGVPILPMLAQRLKSPTEMIQKMEKVAIEPKLDGLRVQIHFQRGEKIKAFTRNLNEVGWMFPELQSFSKYTSAKQLIVDSEAVGLDEETKKLASFQTTMTRRRKHGIEALSSKIKIKFWLFDLLYKNGQSLVEKTYLERRKELEKTVKNGKFFELVDYQLTNDPQVINKLNQKYQGQGLEGLIVKKADSKYVPGRTGWRWVKMKEAADKPAKLADTIDCIIMGYTQGKGKRAQFGIGQFLAGIREQKKILTITKVGTGLSDAQFKELKKRLHKFEVKEKPANYEVSKNLEPDFWVKPSLVVELAADEITKSPTHTAGLALRFPRLIKFRDDKSPAQATTLTEIKDLFELQ